jgi:transposase
MGKRERRIFTEDFKKEAVRLTKNELLRQEREILKRAATFFAKEGSR